MKAGVGTDAKGLLLSSPPSPGFSLLYTLWMAFRPSFLKILLMRLSLDLLNLCGLFSLRWALLFCERQPVFGWVWYVYAVVILGSACCCALSEHLLRTWSGKSLASAHTALSAALYRKAMSLSHSPQQQTHWAEPLSQLMVEVDRVAKLVVTLPWLFCFSLRVALSVGILWTELGPAVLVGAALLLFLLPVHSALECHIKGLQCSCLTMQEESKNLIKEMLWQMKLIYLVLCYICGLYLTCTLALKLLAWEVFFQHRVAEAWEQELESLQVLGYLKALSVLSCNCMSFLVCLFSLGVFVLMDDGNVLTPSQVFMCLCLFKMMLPPLLKLHTLCSVYKQTKRSLCCLEEFLTSEDLDPAKESLGSLQEHCDRCNKQHHDTERGPEESHCQKGTGKCLRHYLKAFGWHRVILTLLAQLGVCMVCVAQDGLLCVWTAEAKEVQGLEEWTELRKSRLSVYILLGLLQALLVCWAAYCLNRGSLRAFKSLQCELLSSVLHLPLSVHLTTDRTQLLHIFTQDMHVIEEQLPKNLHTSGVCLLQMIATILLVTFIIPVFSLALCPLTFLFVMVQKHIMSSIFSPVCVTHRSSSHTSENLCLSHSLQALSQNLQVQHNSIDLERCALLRLDLVAAVGLFLMSLVLLDSADLLDSGVIALALAYGFNAQWIGGPRGPPGWPQRGELEFVQYGTEGSPISPPFRGLTFRISKGEKFGIISSEKAEADGLISCLLRAVEASYGSILIDGVNIASVGLQVLRSRLHLIPQEPVLFSGSLRAQVDPFARYSDAQVWQVLELCQLKEKAQQLQGQLLHPLQPSCSSSTHSCFTHGQKRLLCLVRALLGKARVLLVEEALNLDHSESEHLLQTLVLTHLPECTVLWLSQDPSSIMNTDRVLVLDAGLAVGFESPSVLIQQQTLLRQLQGSHRGKV
ncbi:ATP-binding cassette sub-family C member 2 [Hoplias malabaricus]|uniref:ATP-binding cassette sub-family C member 2 n=1 Tax=Hoplias malabaricus TaxID=27720 RepID=UPI0034620704